MRAGKRPNPGNGSTLRKPLPTIEKEYILGLVLSCLYRHPVIQKTWIFKGGTCLKKVYLADYRFSEDLDFSLKEEASTDPQEIEAALALTDDQLFDIVSNQMT